MTTTPNIEALAPSFELALLAQRRSPKTIRGYLEAHRQFVAFLGPKPIGAVTPDDVRGFLVNLSGRVSASTVATRYRGLQQFFRWAVEDGELHRSPMASVRPPAVPDAPVPVVAPDAFERLLKACEGRGFAERRDTAMLRLFEDSGLRRAEMAGLELGDLDLREMLVTVHGKGERIRVVPFSPATARALDRYLRLRSTHAHADAAAVWLGLRGPLSDSGIGQMLERRCAQAKLPPLHPHQFRHTFAHHWLAEGGSEGDLMMLAGWRSREMLSRYGKSAATQRAIENYRRQRG